ncbi:hypothetical protein GYA49_03615 [Candidatus Beckwithbacteria bacterium]|nr:hypothetical protein [Candidatus Beckwithbacteria bacterium]
MNKHIVQVKFENKVLAIIIPHNFKQQGITFCTPDEFSQQLAYMNHPKDKQIPPHVHNPVKRDVAYTREVLFIRHGKVRVDFYSEKRKYIQSQILQTGDVILLASGGHGFTMLEPTEMIEVKQGPYAGEADKTRFIGIEETEVKFKKDK